MPELPIYMDHHATTPVDPRVVAAMTPFFAEHYGNAASRHHAFGWAARDAVERARRQVADLIGGDPRGVCFTSGATESDNLAIKGVVGARTGERPHVVTVATEHTAVLGPCTALEASGVGVTYLSPGGDGRVDPARVAGAITPETVLVTVMLANNEIGVLQPIREIAALTRTRGIILHTDATQAAGLLPCLVDELGVDLLSLSAHKIYGPKGVGALYIRRGRPRVAMQPLIDGGGHEGGLRAGTLNVPGIVGFGRAAAICADERTAEAGRLATLRDRLKTGLQARLDGIQVNGTMTDRLPNNLNVSFDGVEGETLLVGIDDIAISSGAACTSAHPEPSHVLRAIGVSDALARASIRFGLGRSTTEAEVDYVVEKIGSLVSRLRARSV